MEVVEVRDVGEGTAELRGVGVVLGGRVSGGHRAAPPLPLAGHLLLAVHTAHPGTACGTDGHSAVPPPKTPSPCPALVGGFVSPQHPLVLPPMVSPLTVTAPRVTSAAPCQLGEERHLQALGEASGGGQSPVVGAAIPLHGAAVPLHSLTQPCMAEIPPCWLQYLCSTTARAATTPCGLQRSARTSMPLHELQQPSTA